MNGFGLHAPLIRGVVARFGHSVRQLHPPPPTGRRPTTLPPYKPRRYGVTSPSRRPGACDSGPGRPMLQRRERGLDSSRSNRGRGSRRTRRRPARWCSERRTARRSATTGTGRMCGPPPSPSTQDAVARGAAAEAPLAAARLGDHGGARRREADQARRRRATTIALAAQRPAQPAAGERRERAVAEAGLAPPPLGGERAAPVLLRVDLAEPARRPRRRAAPSP